MGMTERKYTLQEAVDYISDELLHVCDVEANEVTEWISKNGTPDGVFVLEFVDRIMRKSVEYGAAYDAYVKDKVEKAINDDRPLVPNEVVISRIRALIDGNSDK